MGEHAFGTLLYRGSVAPANVIGEVTNLGGLNLTRDEIEVTHHQSPNMFEEVIGSIRRTGAVTLEGNFVPGDAGQAALYADYLSGDTETWFIVFPTDPAAEFVFDAWVKTAPSTSAPVDGKIPFTAELRVLGDPVPQLNITATADLGALTLRDSIAAVTPVPVFAPATYAYVAQIDAAAANWIEFTVTGAHEIRINGNLATTLIPYVVALPAGLSVTEIVVTHKEVGEIAVSYTFTIINPA